MTEPKFDKPLLDKPLMMSEDEGYQLVPDIYEEADEDDSPYDPVNHPAHYVNGTLECIQWIRVMMTPEEYMGYLKGNILKYLWRHEGKGNPVQDLKKAGWYLEELISTWEV